jgi:hypothetical protein
LGKAVLELNAANPFRNLPKSFFVDTDGKSDIAFPGVPEAITWSRDHARIIQQFGGEIGR